MKVGDTELAAGERWPVLRQCHADGSSNHAVQDVWRHAGLVPLLIAEAGVMAQAEGFKALKRRSKVMD